MSAATISIGTPTSAVEFVRNLPPEQKEIVLAELVREAIRVTGGQALISIQAPEGEPLGYYVPPAIAEEHRKRCGFQLPDEDRRRTERALSDPGRTFEMADFLEDLSREDAKPG
jgi:hypothetical protein